MTTPRFICTKLGLLLGTLALLLSSPAQAEEAKQVRFQREIQPLLRRHCYRCHSNKKARARLNLASRESVRAKMRSDDLIVPGHPEKSYLLARLTDKSQGDVMPLDGEPLSPKEIALLSRWIEEGATWPDSAAQDRHWAYIKPTRPEPPSVKNKTWPKNALDHFITARLEEEKLRPQPEAERARLLRRASLALTGLPPTLKQVDDFLNDHSANAYEKAIDRLLASKRYGEHWARPWLDLARYADSNGFQADQLRESWAYRDWVIKALNANMPLDRFVIEQLAGDLLPAATVEQKIATGFHRTVTCNVEAGVHPEANRVNQIFDRVSTTGTVFLGTTLECAQCHDHKYDPFTQKDYYRLFAYFNQTPLEVKSDGGVQFNFYGPTMDLPLPTERQRKLDTLKAELAQVQAKQKEMAEARKTDYGKWLAEVTTALRQSPPEWEVIKDFEFDSTGREDHERLEDGSVLLKGSVPGTAIYTFRIRGPLHNLNGLRVEAMTHESLPGQGPGRGDVQKTNFILSELTVNIQVDEKNQEKVELHSPQASFSQQRWHVAKAIDGDRKTGWAVAPQFHKPHWAKFLFAEPVTLEEGQELIIKLDQNYGRGRVLGRPRLALLSGDATLASLPDDVRAILLKEPKQRTAKEKARLRKHHAESDPRLSNLQKRATLLEREIDKIQPPSTLIMVEMDKPRETHVMNRGDYLDQGEKVEPGVPEALHPIDPKLPKNRLGFARWLVSKENPLLARVTVNRWWARLFGRGLVTTPEDFGTQAEWPSHPELLDWLAVELMESGWDMKHMLKLMVMSATFRQSAKLTPELRRLDPENRLLARGPRFRLPAETVRDNALSVSGLLSKKMYGPPIMPYQPDGIWKAVGRNQPIWKAADDEDRFRRGLYVVWKRGAPYPSFVNFDAPDRAACTVKRPRTNTPLQALTLMNDPAYAEMALALAQRMMTEAEQKTPESRAAHGLRLCVSRHVTEREVEILVRLYQRELKKLQAEPSLVEERLKNLLPRLRDKELNETEMAAWFAVANVLLCLDETISL